MTERYRVGSVSNRQLHSVTLARVSVSELIACSSVILFSMLTRKAQWLLYVPPDLTFNNSICFVRISTQTAIIPLYNINWLVFITETESVYCAVRTESLTMTQVKFSP